MNPSCSLCGTVSSALQQDLFNASLFCIDCLTKRRAEMILTTLPEPTDFEFHRLSEWEQTFLISVRQQYQSKNTMSDKQYDTLEKIWTKMNR